MKIIFTGGGTAGHAMVNTILIPYLQKKECKISYIGSTSGMEKTMVYNLKNVTYYGISTGKLRRYFSLKNVTDIVRILKGLFQSYKILRMEKPQLIYSSGGYVSVPVVWAAYLHKIPVVLRETDYSIGLANKLCIPFAKEMYVTFPDTKKESSNICCSDESMIIRPELYDIENFLYCHNRSQKPICLVIGGSSGAKNINEVIWNNLYKLTKKYYIIHLCGKGNYNVNFPDTDSYQQIEFVNDMGAFYQLAEVVVTRSGSNAIMEGLLLGKRMVCVPLSSSFSRGEQMLNAKYAKCHGTALIVSDAELNISSLINAIDKVLRKKPNNFYKIEKSKLITRIECHSQTIYEIAYKKLQDDLIKYLKYGKRIDLNDLSTWEISLLDELSENFET